MKTVYVMAAIQDQSGAWVRPGDPNPTLPDDLADRYEGLGLVEVLSHDGRPVVWGSCCTGGEHEHG